MADFSESYTDTVAFSASAKGKRKRYMDRLKEKIYSIDNRGYKTYNSMIQFFLRQPIKSPQRLVGQEH